MDAIDSRLRDMFKDVDAGDMSVDGAVKFLKEELLASYKRGGAARRPQRKTAHR